MRVAPQAQQGVPLAELMWHSGEALLKALISKDDLAGMFKELKEVWAHEGIHSGDAFERWVRDELLKGINAAEIKDRISLEHAGVELRLRDNHWQLPKDGAKAGGESPGWASLRAWRHARC